MMTEGDAILAVILVIGFALLGISTTLGWSRNARETRRIREAVEAWVLQDLAKKLEQERREVRPPEDLVAFLNDLLARMSDGVGPTRALQVQPIPGEPAFRVMTERGVWILSSLPPPSGRRATAVDAITTGDRFVAERLRLARMAAEPRHPVSPTERWWLYDERPISLSAWRSSIIRTFRVNPFRR